MLRRTRTIRTVNHRATESFRLSSSLPRKISLLENLQKVARGLSFSLSVATRVILKSSGRVSGVEDTFRSDAPERLRSQKQRPMNFSLRETRVARGIGGKQRDTATGTRENAPHIINREEYARLHTDTRGAFPPRMQFSASTGL